MMNFSFSAQCSYFSYFDVGYTLESVMLIFIFIFMLRNGKLGKEKSHLMVISLSVLTFRSHKETSMSGGIVYYLSP